MMHRVLLISLMLAASLFAARPTDYSTDMVVLDGSQVIQTMKLYVSGHKSRLEGMTAGPLGPIVTISRKDRGVHLGRSISTTSRRRNPWRLLHARPAGSEQSGSCQSQESDPGQGERAGLRLHEDARHRGHNAQRSGPDEHDLGGRQPGTADPPGSDGDRAGESEPQGARAAGDSFEIPAGYVKTNAPGMPAGMILPGSGGTGAQVITGAPTPAPSSNRLEADTLRIVRRTSGEAAPARLAEDGYAMPGAFTGNRTLNWRNAGEVGAVLELIIPAAQKGRYGLSLHLGKYRTFGTFQFLVNGSPVGAPVDFFGYPEKDEVVAFSIDLGEVVLNQGDNRLALKLVGTNPDTVMPDYGACIDWVQLAFKEIVASVGVAVAAGQAEQPVRPMWSKPTRCASSGVHRAKQCRESSPRTAMPTKANSPAIQSLQWHDAAEPGAVLELALPVEKKGRYAVSVRVARVQDLWHPPVPDQRHAPGQTRGHVRQSGSRHRDGIHSKPGRGGSDCRRQPAGDSPYWHERRDNHGQPRCRSGLDTPNANRNIWRNRQSSGALKPLAAMARIQDRCEDLLTGAACVARFLAAVP